jgi:hypothetical protein
MTEKIQKPYELFSFELFAPGPIANLSDCGARCYRKEALSAEDDVAAPVLRSMPEPQSNLVEPHPESLTQQARRRQTEDCFRVYFS